jgi:hypothetical protein
MAVLVGLVVELETTLQSSWRSLEILLLQALLKEIMVVSAATLPQIMLAVVVEQML